MELGTPVRIKAHPGLCQGYGECHRWSQGLIPIDNDGHIDIHLMEVPDEHRDNAWWGAVACPMHAISVQGFPIGYRPKR